MAEAVGHPDVAGNVEMYLAEFCDKVNADTSGSKPSLNPPRVEPDYVRTVLPTLMKMAHNQLAEEQGLIVLA